MIHRSALAFRVATLNLEQDHKRWEARRELVIDQLAALQPDVMAFNEICTPLQTGRWLQRRAHEPLAVPFALVQQSKIDGEALLTCYPVVETANQDYRTLDIVALVVRLEIEKRVVDTYVTYLFRSRGDDVLRLQQVQQLPAWMASRDDVEARIVCGDFNVTLEMPSAQLRARVFRLTQIAPTAFTPLQDTDDTVSHPYWDRFDRGIDYIWVAGPLTVPASGVCFNTPSATDPTLWPSDHASVWADMTFIQTRRSAQMAPRCLRTSAADPCAGTMYGRNETAFAALMVAARVYPEITAILTDESFWSDLA